MADKGDDLARLSHEHAERLKELAALHDTARLLRDATLTISELLSRVVARLPAAMQFVDDTTARIAWNELEVASPGWAATPWVLRRVFGTADGKQGVLEVAYGSPHPEEQEGPFLSEERA